MRRNGKFPIIAALIQAYYSHRTPTRPAPRPHDENLASFNNHLDSYFVSPCSRYHVLAEVKVYVIVLGGWSRGQAVLTQGCKAKPQ